MMGCLSHSDTMTHQRRDGFYILILGCATFMLFGLAMSLSTPGQLIDFKAIYYSGRCVLSGHDPYSEDAMIQAYIAGEGPSVASSSMRLANQSVTVFVYPPTALLLAVPIALLPLKAAIVVWQLLIAACGVLSSFLLWNLAADFAPRLCAILIAVSTIGSGGLFLIGNIAGIVICMCLVSTWCFLRHRCVWAAATVFAFCLVIKPHDVGLVWLYFLLAGGAHRKNALRTLALSAVLGCLALALVPRVSPQWIPELKGNLATTSAPGGRSDPGPQGVSNSSIGMIVDLQAAISVFCNSPLLYNLVSYSISGALFLCWIVTTLRFKPSLTRDLLALGTVSALTNLGTYHRNYDARIVLLVVPACALAWSLGKTYRYIAASVTFLTLLFTCDFFIAVLLAFKRHIDFTHAGLLDRVVTVLIFRPIPLLLLATTLVYLWIYWQQSRQADLHGAQ